MGRIFGWVGCLVGLEICLGWVAILLVSWLGFRLSLDGHLAGQEIWLGRRIGWDGLGWVAKVWLSGLVWLGLAGDVVAFGDLAGLGFLTGLDWARNLVIWELGRAPGLAELGWILGWVQRFGWVGDLVGLKI